MTLLIARPTPRVHTSALTSPVARRLEAAMTKKGKEKSGWYQPRTASASNVALSSDQRRMKTSTTFIDYHPPPSNQHPVPSNPSQAVDGSQTGLASDQASPAPVADLPGIAVIAKTTHKRSAATVSLVLVLCTILVSYGS